MSVPAPTVQADLAAAMGKSIAHETNTRLVDDRAEKEAMVKDKRDTESTVTADPWSGMTPDQLLDDPNLANLSSADLARKMGLEINDKSESAGPDGDATVHDINTALATGQATAPADDAALPATAAPAAAASALPAAAPAASAAPATAQPASSAAPAAATAGEDLFVESRNGQGRIRYEVLQNERTRRQTVEAENAELRRRLAEQGTAAPAADEPAASSAPASTAAEAARTAATAPQYYTEQQIASLRERYDEAVVDMLVTNNRIAVDAYNEVHRLRTEQGERETRTVADLTQDLIDEHPLLSKWQNADPQQDAATSALWKEAVATDAMLKLLPGWTPQEKPWQERIQEAARRVAVAHGIEIPKPNQTSTAAGANTPAQPSLQDRADAALKAASGHVQLPVSHSDLPAGVLPAQSERESVLGMSNHKLFDKLMGMTPEKQMEYLATVA